MYHRVILFVSVSLIQAYHINKSSLIRVHDISDLGVIFDSTLSFNKHLLHTISKSSMVLGTIIRNYKDFANPVGF